jgi:hypothetical protein
MAGVLKVIIAIVLWRWKNKITSMLRAFMLTLRLL